MVKDKSFIPRAKSWASRKGLFGPQAFFRYVAFTFVECLSDETEEFICKGGYLLWLYINTPRQTIDLDLVTLKTNATDKVRAALEKGCKRGKEKGVSFKVLSLKEVTQENEKGASVTIGYRTDDGASNKFDIDIVYIIPTLWKSIPSPISEETQIRGATIENIIVDKLSACHQFQGGNTRMKDYDDLWRISKSNIAIHWVTVKENLEIRGIPLVLNRDWINSELELAWNRHIAKYEDLPQELKDLFKTTNRWISRGIKGSK